MVNKELVNFIKEARKRGFDDSQIKKPLFDNGWPLHEIENAFRFLTPKSQTRIKYKNKITLFLDSEVVKELEKRSKKNMLTLSEMIEDILRRSVINSKKIKKSEEKLDDMFISLFSRKTPGKPRKSMK